MGGISDPRVIASTETVLDKHMSIFDEPSRKPLPQPTFEDIEHAGRKGLVSLFPVLGGIASELLGVLSSPVAQRRDDWLSDLQRRLLALEGQVNGFRFDDLGKNPQFVSAVLQANNAALRTHQSEKLTALQNAVVNVAVAKAPSEDMQQIFLNLVDGFTPTHLQVLKHFQGKRQASPVAWREQRDLTDQAVYDLHERGLLRDTRPLAARNRDSPESLVIYDWEVTNLGRQFLQFIESPEVEPA
jgi:hypothetical protein